MFFRSARRHKHDAVQRWSGWMDWSVVLYWCIDEVVECGQLSVACWLFSPSAGSLIQCGRSTTARLSVQSMRSTRPPGQVDTSAAANGTRPSWSVNSTCGRAIRMSSRPARSQSLHFRCAGEIRRRRLVQRQHRDQRWSERASADGPATGRLVFIVRLIRQFV